MSYSPSPLGSSIRTESPAGSSSSGFLESTPKSHLSISKLSLAPGKLARLCRELVVLLKSVDACGYNLYDGPALQRAVWRYETMWLPLLAALKWEGEPPRGEAPVPAAPQIRAVLQRLRPAGGKGAQKGHEIVPPLDVAWVWYVHRLSVEIYLRDVQAIVGVPVAPDASVGLRFGSSNRSGKSALWRKAYSKTAPDEKEEEEGDDGDGDDEDEEEEEEDDDDDDEQLARELDGALYFPSYLKSLVNRRGKVATRTARVGSVTPVQYVSQISYDIFEAVQRHRGILWLYMRNMDTNEDYLTHAVGRYQSYMLLRALNPGKQLEATDDIDFVWRVHAASTKEYVEDDLVYCALSGGDTTSQHEEDSTTQLCFGHAEAHAVHFQKNCSEAERQDRLRATARVWSSAFGNIVGSYIISSHVPRLLPRGKRDGYLQEIIRRKFAGDSDCSTSDSDSSDFSSKGESGCEEGSMELQSGLLKLEHVRTVPRVHSESTISNEASPLSFGSMSNMFSPGGGEKQVIRDPATKRVLPVVSVSSKLGKRFRFRKDLVQPSSDAGGIPRSSIRSLKHPAPETSSDSDSSEADDDYSARRKLDQKLRREEEAQIRRERMERQGHKLSGKTKSPTFTRAQLFRFAVLFGVALAFVAVSLKLMTSSIEMFKTLGVACFASGLICLLLATLVLQYANEGPMELAPSRGTGGENGQTQRMLQKNDATEKKKKVLDVVQFHEFSIDEPRIAIGGGSMLTSFKLVEPDIGDPDV